MKPKRRLLLGLLLTSLLAGGALYLFLDREPSYQGRSLSSWLTELDSFVHLSKYRKAEEAVRHMGTNALPHLLTMLEIRDSKLKRQFISLTRKQRWLKLRVTPDYHHHIRAGNALLALGTNATPAVSVLADWIDPESVSRKDVLTRLQALKVLGELAPLAQDAVPALLRSLDDQEPKIRGSAALTLGQIGQEPATVVPALITCLRDPNPEVRGSTMSALGKFGANAKAAVPALEQALNEVNVNNQHLALSALYKIEPARQAGTPQWQAIQKTIP